MVASDKKKNLGIKKFKKQTKQKQLLTACLEIPFFFLGCLRPVAGQKMTAADRWSASEVTHLHMRLSRLDGAPATLLPMQRS